MANVEVVKSDGQGGQEYTWPGIALADVALAALVKSGKYMVTVEGTFGGASIELKGGKASANVATIDNINLNYSANGSYNIEVGRGYFQPILTGGDGTTDLNVYLTPITR